MKRENKQTVLKNLHDKFMNNSSLYEHWHNHPNQHNLQIVVLVLVVAAFMGMFLLRFQTPQGDRELVPLQSDAANINSWTEREEKLSEYTKELLNLANDYKKASGEDKQEILTLMTDLARQRSEIFKAAADQNPGVALRASLPGKLRNLLPAEVSKFVEEEVTKEGKFEWLVADSDNSSRDLLSIIDSHDNRFELKFGAGSKYPKAMSDSRIKIKGFQIDNKVLVSQAADSVQVLGATTPPQTKKVAVILFNFQNNNSQPFTVDQVRSTVFTGTPSASNYYQETSFGQLKFSSHLRQDGDVFGWYTLPSTWKDPVTGIVKDIGWNIDCPGNHATSWVSLAEAAAKADGFVASNYTNIIYSFPQGQCGWNGIAGMGGDTARAWINGTGFSLGVVTHELGHNFGRHHAAGLSCVDASGLPVAISSTCPGHPEYGDPFNVMGNWNGMRHMHNFHKGITFGSTSTWLDSSNTKTIDRNIAPDATYTILPIETNATGVQSLRIPKSQPIFGQATTGFYYLEFRQPVGYDTAPVTDPYFNGVTIRYGQDYTYPNGIWQSYLIDTTPLTYTFADAPLAVGQTFTDPEAAISITVQSISSAGANVRVSFGPMPCQNVKPTITISPYQTTAAAGQTISYQFDMSNNDASNCSSSTYTVTPKMPAGWISTPASFTETLSPNASVRRTFLVTVSPTEIASQKWVDLPAVKVGATYINATASSLVTVLQAPAPGPTPTPGGDTIAPTVTITSPANNVTVKAKGKLSIAATVYDNIRVANIKLYLDSTLIKTCTSVTKCSTSINLPTLSAGTHQVKVDATDTSGNVGTKMHTITK